MTVRWLAPSWPCSSRVLFFPLALPVTVFALQDWEKVQKGKHVVYGSTELFCAEEFVQQLKFLGDNSG